MKLSVSLPGEDVEFLDAYAKDHALESRSAAVQHAVRALRFGELQESYEGAWAEWVEEGDAGAWDATAADGI